MTRTRRHLDEDRELMRLRHYSIHIERAYCQVLKEPLDEVINAVRAPGKVNVPVVMT
jgi:hypothetical protein